MTKEASTFMTLTAVEVAELLHCSQKTVLEKAGLGEIPGAKVGRHWFFKLDHIIAYANEEIDRQTEARKSRYSPSESNQPPVRAFSEPVKKRQEPPDLSPYRHLLKP